jgi:ribosomal protein S27AE
MNRYTERKRAGVGSFTVAGKPVRCGHCGGGSFELRRALLNTAGLTFFKLDWANRQAAVLVCGTCGLAQWFLQEPERAD